MPDILLAALNARYAHCALGLRYLHANLGDLRPRASILEFDIGQRPIDIAERLLHHEPRLIALGVHVWNAGQTEELAAILKRLRPDLPLVMGGPEVSFEHDLPPVARHADCIIAGEADLVFGRICDDLLAGRPVPRLVAAEPPALDQLALPYDLYDAQDIAHRVLYVEASRGCPFRCEFCLSSLDVPLRAFPLDAFLAAMQSLLCRGARRLKFVDRTFNLDLPRARAILEFFLDRMDLGLFLHFEMIPDRLPEALRELLARFLAGAVQLEVGIQTFNEEVAARIGRRQDNARAEENLRFLRRHTGVHLHADLIAGLPGEDLASFAAGFDRLVALDPHEIQVGILKRLRGAPIDRHTAEWEMVYSPHPPYEVLSTRDIDFATMQRLRRFARYWDMVANSGHFPATSPLIWQAGSPFDCFMRLSDWLFERTGRTHAIALNTLCDLLQEYLAGPGGPNKDEVHAAMKSDVRRHGRKDVPQSLRISSVPPRQRRHSAD